MTAIIKSIHKFEDKFECSAEYFAYHHPYLAFAAMFIGVPVIILAGVVVTTMAAAFPMAWMFGWL